MDGLSTDQGGGAMNGFFGALALLWCAIAMVVHVWVCVATNWAAMLIIGLFFFPVGIVHGSGIMLGFW
jgi:hypothetical protein